MRLLSLLAAIPICCNCVGNICAITNLPDMVDPRNTNCTTLIVDGARPEIAHHPLLFEKLRTALEIRRLTLFNSDLKTLVDSPTIRIESNGVLELANNRYLETLPIFTFDDGSSLEFNIRGNPRINTNQLIDECHKKHCTPSALANIQEPFTCPLEEPLYRVCKVISDDIDLTEFDGRLSMLDQLEVLVGTLSLKGSNATSFPKLKNLVLLKQPKKGPVLIIEDNPKLSSLEALYNLEIRLRKGERPDNAISIGNNPNLCIDEDASTVPFVIKYLSRVPICEFRL
nr:EGF receptor domain containing protein [Haemonchus contortus]